MTESAVPWWVPHPSLVGWTVSGIGHCADDRGGTRASVMCFAGPNPLGGPVDMLIAAEEPGIGIGAHFAGLDAVDPAGLIGGAADLHIEAGGHACPLWCVPTADDRATYVGEALGMWLWVVVWPPDAALLLLDDLKLCDVRESAAARESLVFGAPSPRMSAAL